MKPSLPRAALLAACGTLACGGPLPEEWAPGTFCGVGEEEKQPSRAAPSLLGEGAGTWTGAIVNGVAEPDPAVADLSDRQQLAVGAMVDPFGGANFCTGTLVGDDAVLTAAHCVAGADPAGVGLAVGPDASRPLHTFRVAAIHVNPLWDGFSASHDNAVCTLSGLVSTDYPTAMPLAINTEALDRLSPAFVGRSVQNVGYGTTEPGGGGFNTRRWWTVESIYELGQFEYTTWGGGTSAVCFGDSGSPGLLTFGDGTIRVVGTLNGGDADCVSYDHWARTDVDAAWLSSLVTPAAGCGFGPRGRCNGTVAEWCVGEEEGDLRSADCARSGRVCGRDRDGNFRCLAGERCPATLTFQGRCDGDVAVWCQDGLVHRWHCAPCGQVCRWVDNAFGYYCSGP